MPVIIRTEQELAGMRGGQEYSLASNITLTRPWKAVDADDIVIHGNGYLIRGLTEPLLGGCSRLIVDRLALAVVIDTANLVGEPGHGAYAGGLVRVASEARIEDCVCYGSVRGSSGYFAGLCGHLADSVMRRCVNHAAITYIYDQDRMGAACGGLVATAANSTIESSENAADATVNACEDLYGAERTGGIAAAVTNCTLMGNVNRAEIIGSARTGGICGTVGVSEAGQRSLVDGNTNYGRVTGQRWFVGGIAGEAGSSRMAPEPDILFIGNVCYGSVSGAAPSGALTGEFIGGIVGFVSQSHAAFRDNAAFSEVIQGLRFVHRILGSNQSRYTSPQSPASRVVMAGCVARGDMLVSGDNLFIDGPKSLYYNRRVSDDDPQARVDGFHGESVDAPREELSAGSFDAYPMPVTPYNTVPSYVVDNTSGKPARPARAPRQQPAADPAPEPAPMPEAARSWPPPPWGVPGWHQPARAYWQTREQG
ncbi:MAG: hypothetical protein LBS11_09015 [Oscillospiraceae bacterium]|nr:hypothetical protein [Oscillospiraceae bacterium]